MTHALSSVARSSPLRGLQIWLTIPWIVTIGLSTPEGVLGATLADMFAGGSITAGNARFDNWELVSTDATSGVLPNFSQITVSPLANDPNKPGIQILGNGQLTTSGINALDIYLQFRVSKLTGGKTFTGHELNLSGVTFGGLTGRAVISQELAGLSGELGSAVSLIDNEAGISMPLSMGDFALQSSFTASVNVFLNGLTSTINLTSFSHRFNQTGPVAIPGDFDNDGDVDGADFLLWQRSPSVGNLADWQANFGAPQMVAAAAVPEPAGIVLLLVIGLIYIVARF